MTLPCKRVACRVVASALFALSVPAAAAQPFAPPAPMPAAAPSSPPASGPGLAPPPPVDPSAPGAPNGADAPLSTREQLEKAEQEDNHRTFEFFWIDVVPGALSYANLGALSNDKLGLKEPASLGPEFGLGAGIRFATLSFGARARYHALPRFGLWRLNAEGGFKFPIHRFDVFLLAHGGYAFLGTVTKDALEERQADSAKDVSANGFNAGLDVGFDYFLSPNVTLGFGATADALFLYRDKVALPSGALPATSAILQNDALYSSKGSAVGITTSALFRLGFRFGI